MDLNWLRQASLGKTYYIETYGCQMNVHDSERIAGILCSIGFEEAPNMDKADLIIFNTCCVRENAERKVFGNVGALKQRKTRQKGLVIAVCGCMMQQKPVAEKLARTFRFVDIIFGTKQMHELPEMLYRVLTDRQRVLAIDELEDEKCEEPEARRAKGPAAYINIMQGCNNFCSYCIVPYVRGRERSREPEKIVDEVLHIQKEGYNEVLLLGQNVNSYGRGLETPATFSDLLKRISDTGIGRIRFMTSHPKDISDELITTMAERTNICKQIHLPVQSGSNRILKLMNRGYTTEHYMGIVEKLHAQMPEIAVSTDIIVGFPGETQQDFEETLQLLKVVRFDSAFTFMYSLRSGTRAAGMPGHLTEEEKSRRLTELIEIQDAITYEKNRAYMGKIQSVLVEGESKRNAGDVCGARIRASGTPESFAGARIRARW